MNAISKKLQSMVLVFLFLVFSLSGCGTAGVQESAGEKTGAPTAAVTAGASAEKAPDPDIKQGPEESGVEVIANQAGKDTGLTVAPIAAREPASAPTQVPVSSGPDHFVITVAAKDQTHAHYGKGHEMAFLVNNEQGKDLVLERGKTYRFDVATDPMHDVYFSLKEIGWGSTPYSEGIEGQYTYKGTITITPTEKTPDELFYACRNHPYMGGKIHIVNAGETVAPAKKASTAAVPAAAVQNKPVSKADANQKLMFADMLLKSKNSETILKSNNSEAIALYKKAETGVGSARQNLEAGKNAQAYQEAENSIALLKQSAGLVPGENAMEHLEEQNRELLASIHGFEAAHKDHYERVAKKQGKDAAVGYDKAEVQKLIKSAEEFTSKGEHAKANRDLHEAQHSITVALQKMLHNQTIVYDLKFESAQEEYEYELSRFKGYEELVPVAIEQQNPAAGPRQLMESFVKKGQDLRDRALEAAASGDFPTAIAMLHDATNDVRRALRMIGVTQ